MVWIWSWKTDIAVATKWLAFFRCVASRHTHTHIASSRLFTHMRRSRVHLRRTFVDANAKFQLIARSLKIIFTLIDGALFFACEHLFEIICTCHTHKSLRLGLLTDIDDFSHLITIN